MVRHCCDSWFHIPYSKLNDEPWLVWLSGLSAGLRTKASPVHSQSGHVPVLLARPPVGVREWQPHIDVSFSPSPSLSPSLPLSVKINK